MPLGGIYRNSRVLTAVAHARNRTITHGAGRGAHARIPPMSNPSVCPRCHDSLDTLWGESWEYRSHRPPSDDDHVTGTCLYEPCDDLECRALKDPNYGNVSQLADAYEHFKSHRYLSGCAHGQ